MDLKETPFDLLNNGKECLFRTDKRLVLHAVKTGPHSIITKATGEASFTGQYHTVWEIDPPKSAAKPPGPDR